MSPPAWQTKRLPAQRDTAASDGSDVRVLLGVAGGGMAHFELGPGETSIAVVHRTIDEVWYFLRGRGEMWRKMGDDEEVVEVGAAVCVTIPVETRFQFRSFGFEPLSAIGATMPPWPGEGEAVPTDGPWTPTVEGAST
jgi:mannose-6-phosphate isomerase-like protein (cupin superfamily)